MSNWRLADRSDTETDFAFLAFNVSFIRLWRTVECETMNFSCCHQQYPHCSDARHASWIPASGYSQQQVSFGHAYLFTEYLGM